MSTGVPSRRAAASVWFRIGRFGGVDKLVIQDPHWDVADLRQYLWQLRRPAFEHLLANESAFVDPAVVIVLHAGEPVRLSAALADLAVFTTGCV